MYELISTPPSSWSSLSRSERLLCRVGHSGVESEEETLCIVLAHDLQGQDCPKWHFFCVFPSCFTECGLVCALESCLPQICSAKIWPLRSKKTEIDKSTLLIFRQGRTRLASLISGKSLLNSSFSNLIRKSTYIHRIISRNSDLTLSFLQIDSQMPTHSPTLLIFARLEVSFSIFRALRTTNSTAIRFLPYSCLPWLCSATFHPSSWSKFRGCFSLNPLTTAKLIAIISQS